MAKNSNFLEIELALPNNNTLPKLEIETKIDLYYIDINLDENIQMIKKGMNIEKYPT